MTIESLLGIDTVADAIVSDVIIADAITADVLADADVYVTTPATLLTVGAV